MGINYYIPENYCEKCKRFDRKLHVGKASEGWKFAFRGYQDRNITSFKDWKEIIEKNDNFLVDSCGDIVPADFFINLVNLSYSYGGKDAVDEYPCDYHWHDEEGYVFCGREFC